jgi:hypothetical protein
MYYESFFIILYVIIKSCILEIHLILHYDVKVAILLIAVV